MRSLRYVLWILGGASSATLPLIMAQDGGPPLASWSTTSPLAAARYNACSVRLADGRILVAGGTGADGTPLSSVELYSPDGTFAPGTAMNAARAQHACVLLPNRQVLAMGGDANGSAELFDPASSTWSIANGTGAGRVQAAAATLADGRAILAGGVSPDGLTLASIDLYSPVDNTFTTLANAVLTTPRTRFAAVPLRDGRVMFIGGANDSIAALDSVDVFDPSNAAADGSAVTQGPGLYNARAAHSATLLDDGRVLVAGGANGDTDQDSLELYDPRNQGFSLLANLRMSVARRDHSAILIPGNGGILLAGGTAKGQATGVTELFQPDAPGGVNSALLRLGELTLARSGMTIAAVSPGQILAAGGVNADGAQAACGLLLTPFLQLDKALYRPLDSVLAGGGNFKIGTTLTFTLELISGSNVTLANSRLVNKSVVTPGGGVLQLLSGFSALPILSTTGSDAGQTILLIAQGPGITLQVTAPIRIATTLKLTLPQSIYEGLDTSVSAVVSRNTASPLMTGTLILSAVKTAKCLADGSANTVQVGEANGGPGATTLTINSASVAATVTKPMPSIELGLFQVTASYSGDAANDRAVTTACFATTSRTPTAQISGLTANPQAGVPFTVSVSVTPNAGNPAFPPNGTVNFLLGGFPLGTAQSSVVEHNPLRLVASRQFTPLSTGPLSFTAQYSGDTFFRNASTGVALTVTVVKVQPTVTAVNVPATFTCDGPVSFGVQVGFPSALGLSSGLVASAVATLSDGSVRGLNAATGTGVFTVTSPGLATAAVTLASVPSRATSLSASFPGDLGVAPGVSFPFRPVLQRSAPVLNVSVNSPTTIVSNPANLVIQLSQSACSTPFTGNIEIVDGANPISVSAVPQSDPSLAPSPGSVVAVTKSISLPSGTHNITVNYSGDVTYLPASKTITVVFQ